MILLSRRAGFAAAFLLLCFANDVRALPLVAGMKAPLFARTDLDGKAVDLRALRGKIVLLDFWATWCPPCLIEIPHLIELQKRYGAAGLQIVGVSLDESIAPVRAARQRFAFNYPIVLGDAKFAEAYGGILGLPVMVVIAPDGNIARVWKNETLPSNLQEAVKPLLRP